MVEPTPPTSRVESLLQAAVQTVQWTYSLFWKLCPQQGNLVWSDGYYNGAIKTRKTVQPSEESAEEATLQRSQQLRDLYESLVAGSETATHQPRRPSASLSPEDLTESEWFYLMCVSFSFPPGVGLPGKAYRERQHIWLTKANEADSRLFSRTILAKSAKIQTVLCIPLLDGVVELGTTEKIEEDIEVIERVKSFFSDCKNPSPNPNPNPPLSELSTSNSPTGFYYPVMEEYSEPQNSSPEAVQLHMSSQGIIISPDASPDHKSYQFSMESMHHSEEDTHYSQTVSGILENQSNRRWSKYSSSAFVKWMATATSSSHRHSLLIGGAGTSQWALKYVLITVPLIHSGAATPQCDLNGSHVLAERRRREKLNERFLVLRSMVPFITKIDKASILGDTIEYLKQLKKRIRELESNGVTKEEKKMRKSSSGALVEVSIIESDALVEIQCCPKKQGLLLDVMQALQGLGIQVTSVESSINAGTFTAHFRAKVKENAKGRKPSIIEVKRTINQIIQHH